MNAERIRTLLLALPHVVETVQFGDNLVFWVGDKAVGGKMFALLSLDAGPGTPDGRGHHLLAFAAATPADFADLLEREGVLPAPYMARIHWVSVTDWNVFNAAEWHDLLAAAHGRVLARHTAKTRAALELPAPELRRLITARRKLLAAKAAAKAAVKISSKAPAKAAAGAATARSKPAKPPRKPQPRAL